MEHKEYEYINMAFRGVNRDPAAFSEVDKRYREALKEIEDRRRGRVR